MTDLAGRIALVTGAGRGIGHAVAVELARRGARVALAARTESQLLEAAAEISAVAAGTGPASLPLVCDVSSPTSVRECLETLAQECGPADILVNAAGVAASAPLGRTTDEIWDRMIAVNLTGSFLTMRALVPAMAARGWGRVVNIASTAGREGYPYVSAYCASKHGLVGLTRAVAAEVAAKGVTVNAICPGYVDTEMTRGTIENIVRVTGRSEEEARRAVVGANPQGRLITPGEVAGLVVTLCLPDSGGINGQAIVLDGGGVQA